MKRIILKPENIQELVSKNKYKVDGKIKLLSRCIDGRYRLEDRGWRMEDGSFPALAFPGADVGELALIFATANSYGFETDEKKVLKSFLEVIGGVKNFRLHTDSHADLKIPAGGCGHFKQINLDPKAYNLETTQIDFIKKNLNIGENIVLHGDHLEGAVLLVKGSWGVYPQYNLETDQGKKLAQVFIYHQTLVDERHKLLAKKLIENKAVIFKNGEDNEWLYNALSDVSENHLMETAKRLAKGLPIYSLDFKENGEFKIVDQGVV